MPNLLEDPLPVIFLGIAIEAVLAVILVRTGRGALVWAMASVAVLTLALVGLEWLVVTDREQVEQTIDGLAEALEANDVDRVIAFLDPTASASIARARWALGRIEVEEANVRNLQVAINKLTSPPSAKARFFGLIRYKDRLGEIPYNSYGDDFTLELRWTGERWIVTGHTESRMPR